ncbi:16718_t:CDS:2 [Funneliformis caledonium]|uniref:16718_t:CDS:1 n=1 Tax=Funneliformis caledonium TaxID=1117310 RepID=A0A9N8WLG1_9GLOM|nr:16718_t:CDS:2 [Funneliformis caledonium]
MKLLLLHTIVFVIISLSTIISLDTKNEDACARISVGIGPCPIPNNGLMDFGDVQSTLARVAIEYQKSNKNPEFSTKYSDVKACLESFPYDEEVAKSISKEFADTTIYVSKDAGIRFNTALATLINNERGDRKFSARIFTFRDYESLPEKSSIEYSPVCANDAKTKFIREWKIGARKMFVSKIYNILMSDIELVYETMIATFYVLSDKKTGVVAIPTFEPGVTKLVLENGGGFTTLFFVYLLFPDSSPSFNNNMVVSELSRAAFEAATSQSNAVQALNKLNNLELPPELGNKDLVRWIANIVAQIIVPISYFNIFSYKDPNTNKHFLTVEEFIGNNAYVRGGTPTSFTSKFVDRYTQEFGLFIKFLAGNIKKYKWETVGGFKDTPLSFASFPGSQVLDLDELYVEFDNIGLLNNETLKDLIPTSLNFPAISDLH